MNIANKPLNLRGYALTVLTCAVAVPLALRLDAPSSCFALFVLISSLYGGAGPGIFSVVLAVVSFDYFFVPPLGFGVEEDSYLRYLVFICSVIAINRMIAAKRSSDESRRTTSEQKRMIAETVPDAILSVDTDYRIQFANPATARTFGWAPEELIGKPLTTLLPQFPCGNVPADLELDGLRKDGSKFTAEAFFGQSRQDGQLSFTGFVRDISERKRMEEALRARERDLGQIIEAIPALVWCAAPDGELDYVNHRILDYTGASMEALAQLGWTSFLHPDDVEPTLRAWTRAVETCQTHEVEYRLRRADGAYRWFHVLGQPQCDAEGRATRWYGLLVDIDDRKAMEEALRTSQARLSRATQIATVGELAASIAHEINQPLAAVVANGHACMQWLASAAPNLDNARLAAERIVRDGNGAAEVVRRIRALFKRAALRKSLLDLNEVIAEVLHLLKSEMVRRRVVVKTILADDLPRTPGDRLQLQQVLLNLLLNGMDAMEGVEGGPRKLIISARRQDGEAVLVEVRDEGAGLPDPERVFEPFFTTKENGMGMGLSISRSIIEAHEGRMWAVSANGNGAAFYFSLPLARSVAE